MGIDLYRFGTYEHSVSFLDGNLYMSALGRFWNEGFEGQKDIMEGLVRADDPHNDAEWLPESLRDTLCAPVMSRAEAMQYCNVLCFYAQRYSSDGRLTARIDPRMREFGEYAVRIHDVDAFLNRVYAKTKAKGDICVSGPVTYHPYDEISPEVDCFWKYDRYAYQQEWRIAYLHRFEHLKSYARNHTVIGLKGFYDEPYTLQIGSLEGIAELVRAEDLIHDPRSVYPNAAIVHPNLIIGPNNDECFSGWDRRYFRERVLKIDGGRFRPILTIGAD